MTQGGSSHGEKVEGSEMGRLRRDSQRLDEEEKLGLFNVRALFFLLLWYIFSFFTLFLNKYIMTTLKGDPYLLGTVQMLVTTALGWLQLYIPLGMFKPIKRDCRPPNFWKSMFLVGCTRFATVFLGLVALEYVAVSFTETVKCSAPLFTVFISRVMAGEMTGIFTQLSLMPIMTGLALCSAYELSFNIPGFLASLTTNITECVQNVYSKVLLSGDKFRYTPAELQFYASVASNFVLIPTCWFLMDIPHVYRNMTAVLFITLLLNGISFHFQSITAYVLMGYISPVTYSVANTVKRALLIWLSVIIFSNPVTFLSGLGTVIVMLGVLAYNRAREIDGRRLAVQEAAGKVSHV